MDKNDLKTNKTDVITSAVSMAAGIVPGVGGVLSGIITLSIPNQRQDRIAKFISELDDEFTKLNIEVEELKSRFNDYKYGAFSYNCLRNVANEVYEEKLVYYKNLYISALTSDEKNLLHCERVLKILNELDYYEILYLKFYSDCEIPGNKNMEEIRKKLGFDNLRPTYFMSMDEQSKDEETYKQITLNNLCNAGLLDVETKYVGKNFTPRINYKITVLGKLILRKIGI